MTLHVSGVTTTVDDNGKLIDGSGGENGWGDATGHTIGELSDCADCHGTYFQYHVYGDTHTGVSYDGGTMLVILQSNRLK